MRRRGERSPPGGMQGPGLWSQGVSNMRRRGYEKSPDEKFVGLGSVPPADWPGRFCRRSTNGDTPLKGEATPQFWPCGVASKRSQLHIQRTACLAASVGDRQDGSPAACWQQHEDKHAKAFTWPPYRVRAGSFVERGTEGPSPGQQCLGSKERQDLQQLFQLPGVPRTCRRCGVSNVPAELWAFRPQPTDRPTDRVSVSELVLESPIWSDKGKPCPLSLSPSRVSGALAKLFGSRVWQEGRPEGCLSEAKSFTRAGERSCMIHLLRVNKGVDLGTFRPPLSVPNE